MKTKERRILVVDDEEAVQFSYQRLLQGRGVLVDTCGSMEEALRMIRKHNHAAAILDLRLSNSEGFEGLEILQYLRKHKPDMKVVFMTGYGNDGIREQVLALRVEKYLVKPVPVGEILDVIDELCLPDDLH